MPKDALHKVIYVAVGLIMGAAAMSVLQGDVTTIARGVFIVAGLALVISAGVALVRALR